MRDLTEKQFLAACKKHGFTVESGKHFGNVILSNGTRATRPLHGTRREQLAYLVRMDGGTGQ